MKFLHFWHVSGPITQNLKARPLFCTKADFCAWTGSADAAHAISWSSHNCSSSFIPGVVHYPLMHFLHKFLVCILPRVACSYLQHFILGLLAHSGFERLLNFVLVHSHCCTNHHSPLYHNLENIFWVLPFPNSNVSVLRFGGARILSK